MFEFLATIFNLLLYRPLFNFLVVIYNYLPGHDFGIAIICLTVIIRIILYPLAAKALESQKILQKLQAQLQEIQNKFKDDKEKQARETLELYKKEKINPFSGLFLVILQFPILIALYMVFNHGLRPEELSYLYNFVENPGSINAMFLGLIDLSKSNVAFAVVAGVVQFFQTKMLMPKQKEGEAKKKDMSVMMQKQMMYFFPFITVIILFKLPSALGLYWIVSGAFSIVQQYFILKKHPD